MPKPPKPGRPVEERELPLVANEVRYEYEMVRSCTGLLFHPNIDRIALLRNLVVESYNVHTRCLLEFFSLPRAKAPSDTVVAQHFAPDWDSVRHGQVDLVFLEEALSKPLNKRLAHITAYRVRVPKDEDATQVIEITSALVCLMKIFINLLPEDRRRWFDDEAGQPIPFSLPWLGIDDLPILDPPFFGGSNVPDDDDETVTGGED